MDAYLAGLRKFPVDARRSTRSWGGETDAARAPGLAPFRLTAEEGATFLRIVSQGALVSRH